MMASVSPSPTNKERRRTVLFTFVRPLIFERRPRANTTAAFSSCGFQRGSVLLPPIVEQTCLHLEQYALLQEGLFRISGAQEDIRYIKDKFERGKRVKLSKVSIDTVAGVLKLFFMELPNPVLTYELYGSFLAALSIKNEIVRLWCVKRIVDILPPGNKAVIDRVCAMFRCISNLQENNKMSSKNIALVMSSSFLRGKNEVAEEVLRTGALRVRLLEIFINFHNEIFLWGYDGLEENLKKLEPLSSELELQLQKFEAVLKQDSQKLATTLATEGEVGVIIKLDDRKPLKGKLYENLSEQIDDKKVIEEIEGDLTIKSRRRGIRCNKIDMDNAFQNFNLPNEQYEQYTNFQSHDVQDGGTELFSTSSYTSTGSFITLPELRDNPRRKRSCQSGTKRKRKANTKIKNKKIDTQSASILSLPL